MLDSLGLNQIITNVSNLIIRVLSFDDYKNENLKQSL